MGWIIFFIFLILLYFAGRTSREDEIKSAEIYYWGYDVYQQRKSQGLSTKVVLMPIEEVEHCIQNCDKWGQMYFTEYKNEYMPYINKLYKGYKENNKKVTLSEKQQVKQYQELYKSWKGK